MADNVKGIFGDYAPTPEKNYTTTPLQGLRSLGNVTHFETGCEDDTQCLDYNQTAVKTATHAADLVIVCLGTGNMILDVVVVVQSLRQRQLVFFPQNSDMFH